MKGTLGIYEGLNLPIIALPVGLAHRLDGNLVAAAMLAQMAFLTSVSRDDGWFDIPMKGEPPTEAGNLYDRCGSWNYMLGAGDRALREARKLLSSLGFLSERLVGVPARLRYKVNLGRYREFLDDQTVRPAKGGNASGADGGAAEEELLVPQGGLVGKTPDPVETGSAAVEESACPRSVDPQSQSNDDPSAAVAPKHDVQEGGSLNGASVDTIPERLPIDVPNPPLRGTGEGGGLGPVIAERHAELIAIVADEAGCSAEALEDAFRDRLGDRKNGALVNVEAWLRSIGRRLAQGEALSWGQAAAQERRMREVRAKEFDDQIRERVREKSPRKLADPAHVARCLHAMPWAKPGIRARQSS